MEKHLLVGSKPIMTYVMAAMTRFSNGSPTIIVKARGNSIKKAVDIVEIVRNRYVKNAKISAVVIGTEKLENMNKKLVSVSTIEISLSK